jgi:hypothetical protein
VKRIFADEARREPHERTALVAAAYLPEPNNSFVSDQFENRTDEAPGVHAGGMAQLRIPSDADQRSELIAIAIPNSCRSPFQSDGDHRSKLMPITRRQE